MNSHFVASGFSIWPAHRTLHLAMERLCTELFCCCKLIFMIDVFFGTFHLELNYEIASIYGRHQKSSVMWDEYTHDGSVLLYFMNIFGSYWGLTLERGELFADPVECHHHQPSKVLDRFRGPGAKSHCICNYFYVNRINWQRYLILQSIIYCFYFQYE